MMTIIALTHSSETKAVLNMLDETLYVVKETNGEELNLLQPDILLISTEAKIDSEHLPQGVPVIVIVEKKKTIKTVFEFAQSVKAIGIVEYQELKHLPELLKKAVTIRQNFQKESLHQSKVVSVMSWKGGVGKSLIAFHLAHYLQKKSNGAVLVIDASLPFGATKAFLNLQTDLSWETIRPALSATTTFTESRLVKNILNTSYGFDVLCADQNKETSFLTPSELDKTVEAAKEKYDIIIVDFPNLNTDFYSAYASLFDLTVSVSTIDTPALYATLKGKETMEDNEALLFVANQVDSKSNKDVLKAIQSSLQVQFEVSIEEDRDAVNTYQQKYKLITEESLVINRDLRHLADIVAQRLTR